MEIYRANLFHARSDRGVAPLKDALIVVKSGVIQEVLNRPSQRRETLEEGYKVTDLRSKGFLLPGFVDLHVHAPQFPQLGKALDVPLEVWLHSYVFPLEARYSDLAFADRVYRDLVKTLLANGTTTALYFATIHTPASLRLAQICLEIGQRALVGRVAMDHPQTCPETYRDPSPEEAIDQSRLFLSSVPQLEGNEQGLVKPVITPRFIPACSDRVLRALGDLAEASGAHVQTHCSESDWEHEHVMERCGKSDTAALEGFGLLTRHTVLAHANFVSPTDMHRIRDAGASVAHCPLSNVYFSNAVFPLRRALEKGLRVGLGTDIAGGPSASLLDSARMSITSSRMLEEGVNPDRPRQKRGIPSSRIDFRTAFWLATRAGADALDVPVGCFEPERHFDAILVAEPNQISGESEKDDEARLQKIIMLASREHIKATWVSGRLVSGGI